MNRRHLVFIMAAGCGLLVILVCMALLVPSHPIALIKVLDMAGKPVAGAVVQGDGLRPKPGATSGHYAWMPERLGVRNDPVITDKDGLAAIPYPKYITERIETGEISFSVDHPDFVRDRPFRTVSTAPPAGSPWRVWVKYAWARISQKSIVVRVPPVDLQRGSTLRLSVRPDSPSGTNGTLYAQVSGGDFETNFWTRPEPGIIMARRLKPGVQQARLIQLNTNGSWWFSDVVMVQAAAEQTNELSLALKPGVTLQGNLDRTVPRPVRTGRVVATIWPKGLEPRTGPPEWHAWTKVNEDGSFEIRSLPQGMAELAALCDGFVSVSGPGFSGTRRPQRHWLSDKGHGINILMEKTARLEVLVTDDKGHPLKDAQVLTSPNIQYGQWYSTILISDCYNLADWFTGKQKRFTGFVWNRVPDFMGTSDSSGLAVVPNVPATESYFNVEHTQFALPVMSSPPRSKGRYATVNLVPGQTNRVSVQMEPKGKAPLGHY